jgi:peptide/nickel transport system permease protein
MVEELRALYGLNLPLHERYFLYLKNMITFNFGRTRYSGGYITQEMSARLLNTLIFIGIEESLVIIVGTAIGLLLALKRGSKTDTGIVVSALTLSSLPSFWVGLLLLTIFSTTLRWFPSGGLYPASWVTNPPTNPLEIIAGRLYHLVLPVLTLFIVSVDNWMLFVRACALETITEDFVVTARAKGLKERAVLFKHVLKPASLPIVTSLTLTFALLWTGAIITENVFNYPGMGRWILRAIQVQDVPIMYAVFYLMALCTVLANFAADLIYGLIDPRVKVGR